VNFLCSWRLQDCSGSRCLAAVIYGVAIAIDVYKYFKGKLALLNPALQDTRYGGGFAALWRRPD